MKAKDNKSSNIVEVNERRARLLSNPSTERQLLFKKGAYDTPNNNSLLSFMDLSDIRADIRELIDCIRKDHASTEIIVDYEIELDQALRGYFDALD